MKKLLAVFALLFLLADHAEAGKRPVFEVGYTTYTITGTAYRCSTGTAAQWNATIPTGFRGRVAGYHLQSHETTGNIYLGNVDLSTSVVVSATNLGPYLTPGADKIYQVGNRKDGDQELVPLHCQCSDDSDVTLCFLSIEWFGY